MSNVINGEVPEHGVLAGRASTMYGKDGESAYAVACRNGFVGTEKEWLESLGGEELKNIRFGANGEEYKTAGEAVRQQSFCFRGVLTAEDDLDLIFGHGGVYSWVYGNVPKNAPMNTGGTMLVFPNGLKTINARTVQIFISYEPKRDFLYRLAETSGYGRWFNLKENKSVLSVSLESAMTEFSTVHNTLPKSTGEANTPTTKFYNFGEKLIGSPYSQVWTRGLDSHWNIIPETLFSALANPASVMYTRYWEYNQSRQRAYYGGICSSFLTRMLNIPFPYVIDELKIILQKKEMASLYGIEVGDVLIQPGHVAFVSKVNTDKDGKPVSIDIADQWTTGVRTYTKTFSKLEQYLKDEEFVVYKNTFASPYYCGDPEYATDVLFEYGNNTYRTASETDEMWFYIPIGEGVYYKKDNGAYSFLILSGVESKTVNEVTVYNLSSCFSGVGKYSFTTDETATKTCDITIIDTGAVSVVDGQVNFTGHSCCEPYAFSLWRLHPGEDERGYDFIPDAPDGYHAGAVLNSWQIVNSNTEPLNQDKISSSGKYMLRVLYDTGCGYKQVFVPFLFEYVEPEKEKSEMEQRMEALENSVDDLLYKSSIEVDESFNAESENPVMNKTITEAMTQALVELAAIQQNIKTLQNKALPTVTPEDNGKVPQVVDGALVYTDVAELQVGDKSLPTYIADAVNTYIEEALGGDY